MCNNERQLLIEEDKPLTTLSLWAHLDSIAKKFQNDKYIYKDEVREFISCSNVADYNNI